MRTSKNTPPPPGNARVNFVMLQVEGETTAIARSIDSLVNAMQRSNVLPAGALTPRPPVALPAAATSGAADDQNAAESPDPQVTLDEIQTPAHPKVSSEERPPRVRTFKVPSILDSIRADQSPHSFKEFVGARTIAADIDKGITAAMYLKTKRDVSEFGTDHLHTCFEMMHGWKLPDDSGSLLRNMKKVGLVRPVTGKKGLFEITSKCSNRYAELG